MCKNITLFSTISLLLFIFLSNDIKAMKFNMEFSFDAEINEKKMALSPNKKKLAIPFKDGGFSILDLATQEKKSFASHNIIKKIYWHPINPYILAILTNRSLIKIYNTRTEKKIFEINEPIDFLEWHPSFVDVFTVVSQNNFFEVFDITTNKMEAGQQFDETITHVSWNQYYGPMVAICLKSNKVIIWNTVHDKDIKWYEICNPHQNTPIKKMRWISPKKLLLITDRWVKIVNLKKLPKLQEGIAVIHYCNLPNDYCTLCNTNSEEQEPYLKEKHRVCWDSRQNSFIVESATKIIDTCITRNMLKIISEDKTLALWSLKHEDPIETFEIETKNKISKVLWHPQRSNMFALYIKDSSVCLNNRIEVWEINKEEPLKYEGIFEKMFWDTEHPNYLVVISTGDSCVYTDTIHINKYLIFS